MGQLGYEESKHLYKGLWLRGSWSLLLSSNPGQSHSK